MDLWCVQRLVSHALQILQMRQGQILMSKKQRDPDYVIKFVKAVYPDCHELMMASFDEERCLTDATELILDQRSKLKNADLYDENGEPL